MIHGASDTHTVFDFSPGFRAAPELAALGLPGAGVRSRRLWRQQPPERRYADYTDQRRLRSRGDPGGARRRARLHAVGDRAARTVGGRRHRAGRGRHLSRRRRADHRARTRRSCSRRCFKSTSTLSSRRGDYFDFGVDFRTHFFYAAQFALPFIIDLDNATRALVPRAEIRQRAGQRRAAPFRGQVTAPVLLMQADHDAIFVPVDDSALFSSSPDVSFTLLRFTGHKIFEHPAATRWRCSTSRCGSASGSDARSDPGAIATNDGAVEDAGEADPAEIRRHQ